MKNNKAALFALAVVALMLASPFVILNDGNGSDATVEDSNWPSQSDYSYKVTYTDASSDLTVMDHLHSDAAVSEWTWNSEGVGPFNMFYAAISTGFTDDNALSNKAGHIAYILDPMNLTHAIKYYGDAEYFDISDVMANYNIMLVIPTVYWGVTENAFYITNVPNDPANTGVAFKAYAHQVDNGDIYPYLAIGVYEAKTVSGKGLMSQTGVAPQVDKTIDGFRADVTTANNLVTDNVGTYQQWNFYEWTLYKLLAETYIFSFDSSAKAGGNIDTSAASNTGLGNTAGPVSPSTATTYGKVLIENAWGSVWDFVDNTYVASGKLKAGSGLEAPAAGSISGDDYTGGNLSIGTSGTSGKQIDTFSQAAASFGVPLTAKTNDTAGTVLPDGLWFKNDQNSVLLVGGYWSDGAYAGLSAWHSDHALSFSNTGIGARLAYLMSADAADSPDFYKEVTYHYNGVGTDGTKVIIVNNANPITLETPTASGYSFIGWYTDPGFDPNTRIEQITTSTPDILDIYAAGTFDIGTDVIGDGTISTVAHAVVGTEVTVTATPGDDKMIKSGSLIFYKTGDRTTFSLIDPSTMKFTMPGYPVTVAATFIDKVYYVTVPTFEHADITASPAFGPKDTSVTLTVEPEEGYRLTNLTVDGQDVTVQAMDGEYSFTLTKDVAVEATFEECTVAYIDGGTETDHYPTVADAFAGGTYQVFNIGKDLSEDITVTGTDKTFVLESGKTLTSKVTMTDGPTKAVVDLKGVKADGELFVYFGSIHINGALAEGDVIVVEGNAVIDGDTEFVEGMSLTINFGSILSISPGSTLTINEGAIFENNGGSIVIEQSTTGGADGKLVFYTGDIVPGAENMARVYNTAPQYIRLTVTVGAVERTLTYGEVVPAGTNVTVHYEQPLETNTQVHFKTFWQARADTTPVADGQVVTVTESTWFYADYPDYDGTSAHGMIWEGNKRTQDLTIQYGFMDRTPDEPTRDATGMIKIPFGENSFEGTRPNYTWRVIHLAEPDNAENPDQYVLYTDTYTQAVQEDVYLVFDEELLPGVYYLTMIADQDSAHRDAQFGFVNYKFLVKGNDYRIGLTWDAAATDTHYAAWVTDINGGYLEDGDIYVDGYEVKEGVYANGSTRFNYVVYHYQIFNGAIDADVDQLKFSRPVGKTNLTLTDTDVDIQSMSGLLPYYVYQKDGKEYTKYGNEVYGIYINSPDVTADINGTYVSTGAVKSVDFADDFKITEKQAISIIRATDADLNTTVDELTCTVGVYYLATEASARQSVESVDLTITMEGDEYYVTTIFDIDSIKTGVEDPSSPGSYIIPYSGGVAADGDAKWILMYDVDAENHATTPEQKDALDVYDLVGIA